MTAPPIDFDGLKIDALLIASLPNVRYVTGFTGSNAVVLAAPGRLTLFTDPRYTIQAEQEAGRRADIRIVKGMLTEAVVQAIRRKGIKRLGFEKAHISYQIWHGLRESVPLGVSLRPLSGVVEELRMMKNAAEIELIRRAVDTNSRAFAAAVKKIRPRMREMDLAAELEYQMRRYGAEKASFETIVASGARTALPHAQPGAQRFGERDMVLVDMGATVNGYTSDMTRMVFLGDPDAKTRKMYKAVLNAQLAGTAAVRAGVAAHQVDRATRRVLKAEGLDKDFVHSTGHGLGLEIHEAPRLGKKDATPLRAGMVVTIEPGVYKKGQGGIRIEDTVLVTEKGREVLTPTSKELTVL